MNPLPANTGSHLGGALLALALTLTAPAPATAVTGTQDDLPDDSSMVAIIDQLSLLGYELGRVAANRGRSEEVKSLGRALGADNDATLRKLGALTSRLKIPRVLQNELGGYTETIRLLEIKPPADFDAAFVRQQIIVARNTADLMKKNLDSVQNPELAELSRGVIADFERHAETAAAVGRKLGIQ
jgi:predicted outer membrane protein